MEKNNKGLIVLVAILSVIILGLVGYIAYDKISVNDENENIVDNNKEEDNSQIEANDDEITADLQAYYSKFSGKYGFGVKTTQCNGTDEFAGMGFGDLEIRTDGTATYFSGMNCGGGYLNEGKYYIAGDNKIYLINDKCGFSCIDGDCFYPNCSKIEIFHYKEENGKISIYQEYNGNITEFERR